MLMILDRSQTNNAIGLNSFAAGGNYSRPHSLAAVGTGHEKPSPAQIYCVNTAPIVANGSQGMWSTIVASGSKRVNILTSLVVHDILILSEDWVKST